ncbi:MAG: crossover junction endodeoxyribonuclease RuvC [Candidatus Blackburnbacteria bacterium]|nr:crossover junction endodeoxyribonuclease RuvC [Candidatus Blackburnbacteria bacterium]
MVIFGVDPGTARCGWGIIETNGANPKALHFGCITTEKTESAPNRLLLLYTTLSMLLAKHKPDIMSIEEIFFARNAKTIIPVGQARGIALLAAAQYKIPVVSYSPPAVKRIVTGDGRADKKQIQQRITRLLHLEEMPKSDDTADALAIALTHAFSLT